MSYIAGPYSWTFGTVAGPVGAIHAIGTIEDAPTIELNNEVDPIKGDATGATLVDGVYRGGSCFLDMVLQEYDGVASKHIFNPYTSYVGEVGCIGSLLSTYADELVGTPMFPLCTLGSSVAGTESLKIFTAKKAVLSPGFPIRLLMGSRLRNVPIRFQLLPSTYSITVEGQVRNVTRFFDITEPGT